jgi:2-polyprenyl-6-hydroxyphenyl methylase/3-demethylubiquinone-9 3-methyltransferase
MSGLDCRNRCARLDGRDGGAYGNSMTDRSTIAAPANARVDVAEVARFERMASEWWDPVGKFRPLHQIGPPRLEFLRERILHHFGRHERRNDLRPLTGLRVLDIGCGGGLVSEPLARMGATVTGIDPGDMNVRIARQHAEAQGLAIDYRVALAEDLAARAETYDVVASLEVIEHVPDPAAFVRVCGGLTRPGGLVVMSTINRTFKAYALAIVGAEYVLRWLPAGTHTWDKFVTPDELGGYGAKAGLGAPIFKGLVYSPWTDRWSLGDDIDVNYLAAMTRPAV